MLLGRYIVAEIAKPLSVVMGVLVAIFLAYSSAVVMSEVSSGEIGRDVALTLIGLQTLIALETLLPTALYLSVIVGLQRLYRDSEMVVMNALGVSEGRVMVAVFWFALAISALVFALSVFGRPWAYGISYALEERAASEVEMARMRTGHFHVFGKDRLVIVNEGTDPASRSARQVFVETDVSGGKRVIYAQEARLLPTEPGVSERPVLFLDGYAYQLQDTGADDRVLKFGSLVIHVDDETQARVENKRKAQPTFTLMESDKAKEIAEFQWRLSTPLATLLLGLLAVPLSRAAPRRGRSYSVVIAIAVYAGIFNLVGMARTWVERGEVSPQIGIWWVHLLMVGLVLVLLYSKRWSRS